MCKYCSTTSSPILPGHYAENNYYSTVPQLNLIMIEKPFCFSGGKFELQIDIPESYPFNPPKVKIKVYE